MRMINGQYGDQKGQATGLPGSQIGQPQPFNVGTWRQKWRGSPRSQVWNGSSSGQPPSSSPAPSGPTMGAMPSVGTQTPAQPDVTKQIANLMTSPAMGNAGVVGSGAVPMAQPAEKMAPELPPMTAPSVGAAPTVAGGGMLPQLGLVKGMPGMPEMAQPGQPPAMSSEIAQALAGQPIYGRKQAMGV